MKPLPVIPLKVRTPYSLAEGAIRIKEILGKCEDQDIPAVGICDSNNLFGALEFAMAASKSGIQPIIGCGISFNEGKLFLYAQNQQGYLNLLELMNAYYLTLNGEVPVDILNDYNHGLLCIAGGTETVLGKNLECITQLKKWFRDRLYIEIPRHQRPDEILLEPQLIELAQKHDVPLLAVNDIFYNEQDMFEPHDALLCIAQGATVSALERRKSNPHYRFKSIDEMSILYEDIPEALANTALFAQRCAFMPKPHQPILPSFSVDENAELEKQSREGLEERLQKYVFKNLDAEGNGLRKQYEERLDYELNIINQMGFPGYFLIVSDFIKWAKSQNIPVGPGRGSGAGSIIAWALSITDLDPINLNLLFERFLNPERVSMPDFDVDFCQERRDEVIKYVQDKYGHDRVAQIITFGKLQARAALRDVGRVLEMPYPQVDRICKLVPNNPANPVTLQQAIDSEQALKDVQRDEETSSLMNTSLKLEGLFRHASTHAAGVVIGDRPLKELIPLYRDPRSPMPVTQFNMKYAETAGLVKFDFLGLKTLTVLQTAVAIVKQRTDKDIDLLALPYDAGTYAMLARGEAHGVFQLESAGMRDVLAKLKPDCFEDIIAVGALYRPGPMDNIPTYIACKHGRQEVDYLHPKLTEMLTPTYGIMIYQEQVMQAAQILAGYSLGGADLLRRAMGKKIQAEMDAQRNLFVEGCKKNNIAAQQANLIFDQIAKFAGYGFNRSHAAAYALISYQTAWMKHNYPEAFMAALMTHDMGNTDKLAMHVQEVKRLNIPLLLPDVNKSQVGFAVEDADSKPAVRYALAAIKGVGEAAMEALIQERKNSRYESIFDFAERLTGQGVNKRLLENLTAAGAFDQLHHNRAAVSKAIPQAQELASGKKNDDGQASLFGEEILSVAKQSVVPDVEPWRQQELLAREQSAIGFYLSSHPLDSYATVLEQLNISTAVELIEKQGRVKLAGVVLSKKEKRSQRGSKFAFVQLSDVTGVYECMLFSEGLSEYRELLESGVPLLVDVDVSHGENGTRLTCQRVQKLADKSNAMAVTTDLKINSLEQLEKLNAILINAPQGRRQLILHMAGQGNVPITMTLGKQYQLEQDMLEDFF